MTRIEKLRSLSLEDMADKISDYGLVDGYCKSDCAEDNDCLHERDCIVRWLNEEVEP